VFNFFIPFSLKRVPYPKLGKNQSEIPPTWFEIKVIKSEDNQTIKRGWEIKKDLSIHRRFLKKLF